ncbi:MAG: septum formation initiator family protein, partial [Deltaproteobacteria bacterium]|nr:septum formation initiator family protein [Deltaproteobacteria bacterium]
RWTVGFLIAVALIVYAVIVFSPGRYSNLNRLNEDYERISALNKGLREQNGNLRKQIGSLEENGVLVEIIARNELGMIKEGEKVFVVDAINQH